MNEFLSFRKMITPLIIQIIFWIGVSLHALFGIGLLVAITSAGSAADHGFIGFLAGAVAGLVVFLAGSLLVRVYCELVILLFKIFDELKAIRSGAPAPGQGFPATVQGYAQPGFPPQL